MKYIIIIFCISLSTLSFAVDWTWQNPLPQGYKLKGINILDTNTVTMLGDYGTLVKSSDGGDSWDVQHRIFTNELISVLYINTQIGWALTQNGTYKTVDGGLNWTLRSPVKGDCAYFLNEHVGWIIFINNSPLEPHWVLHKTIDGGLTQRSKYFYNHSFIYSIYFANDSVGFAIGYNGRVIKTNDGGSNWITISSNTMENLTSLFFLNDKYGWIAGSNGTILKTNNGGNNWIIQETDVNEELYSICFTDSIYGWVTWQYGRILKTNNGGVYWETKSKIVTNRILQSIFFINDSLGWISSSGGEILNTTNGGLIWNLQYKNNDQSQINSIFFIDENNGQAAGYDGQLWKTQDGGQNWYELPSPTSQTLQSLFFHDKDVGWIVGGYAILSTTDGGESWSYYNRGYGTLLYSVYFVNASVGWAVGSRQDNTSSHYPRILKTLDGGKSWSILGSPNVEGNLKAVYFHDQNTGWAVGSEYRYPGASLLLKTTDGGDNWFNQNTGELTGILDQVQFINPDTGWVVHPAYTIKTIDSGINWYIQPNISDRMRIRSAYFQDDIHAWVIGDNGMILKSNTGGGIVSINDEHLIKDELEIPTEINLYQNFPNPFNLITTISFSIPSKAYINLKIYNLTGQHVQTLVDEYKSEGKYTYSFDATDVSSGIYFYCLKVGLNYQITKKMILI